MGLNLNSVYSKKKTVFDIVNTDAARYDKYDDHMLESSYLDNYILECNNMIMESVNDAIVLNESTIGDFIQDVGNIICKIIKAVVDFIAGIINAIVNAIKGVIRFIKDAFTKKKAEEKEMDLDTEEKVVRFEDRLIEKLSKENIYMDICDITNTSNLLNNNCPPLVMNTYSESLEYSEIVVKGLNTIQSIFSNTYDNRFRHDVNRRFDLGDIEGFRLMQDELDKNYKAKIGEYLPNSAKELFGEELYKSMKPNDTLSNFVDRVVNPKLFGSCIPTKTKLTIDLYRKAKDNMNNTEGQISTILTALDRVANVMYKDSAKRLKDMNDTIANISRRSDPKDSLYAPNMEDYVRRLISNILVYFKGVIGNINDVLNAHVKMALYKIRRINLVYGVKGSSLAVITKCEKDLVDKSSYTEHVSIDGFDSDAICSDNFMESMNDSYTKLVNLAEAEYVDKKFSAIFESYLLEDDNNNNNQNNNNNGNNNQTNNNNGNNNNNNGGDNNQNNNNNGNNNQNNQNGDNNQNNNSGNNNSNKKSDDEGILKKIINAIKEFFQKILDLFKKKTDTKDPESAVNQAVHGTPAEKANGEDRTKLWNAFKSKLANFDSTILDINNFTIYKTKDIENAMAKTLPYLDSIGNMQNAIVNPSAINGVLEDAIKNNKSSADIANDLLKKDFGIDDDGNQDQSLKGKFTRFYTFRNIGEKKEKLTQELYNEMFDVVDRAITSNLSNYTDNYKKLIEGIDKTIQELDKATSTDSGVIDKIAQIAPKETVNGAKNESYLYENITVNYNVDSNNNEMSNKGKEDAKNYRILLEGIKNCVLAYSNITNELFTLQLKCYNEYFSMFKSIMKTFNEYNSVAGGDNDADNNQNNDNQQQNNNGNNQNDNNNGNNQNNNTQNNQQQNNNTQQQNNNAQNKVNIQKRGKGKRKHR
jgi:hypothetical protein